MRFLKCILEYFVHLLTFAKVTGVLCLSANMRSQVRCAGAGCFYK